MRPPPSGNIARSAGKLLLIDWDTVGPALPGRDLWPATADGTCDAELYAEFTGRPVSVAAMQMCQMRWCLDDIALAIGDFRARMDRTRTPS